MAETAIYIRTSTEDQNPENQLKDCESVHKLSTDYKLFMDKQSAWKDNKERENFENLKKEIQKGSIKILIVWDLDRIYRNRGKLLDFFNFCKTHKCKILSYRQKFLTEMQELNLPAGFDFIKEMMVNNFLQFLGWIAEDESNKKSDRVKLAVRKNDNGTYSYKGNKWGRKALSTYKLNNLKGYIQINPNATVRQIGKDLGISKSVVHKYLVDLTLKNPLK
jgi:DNA invertase Pin-like site-specific DNA recombinase